MKEAETMTKVQALVLRGPGSNCDHESEFALNQAGAKARRVHINRLLDPDSEESLDRYDLLLIPGGFTYADDIAAGRVMANKMKYHLRGSLDKFIAAGKPVLGICNGFQILLELGLLNVLPERTASLTFNDSGKFECRWSRLRVNKQSPCLFLDGLDDVVTYPVAHGEGKFVTTRESLLALEENQRVVFRYKVDSPGQFPENPNGSHGDIAGICDASGRILALMPHPERALSFRKDRHGMAMGQRLFDNLVAVARAVLVG
jgi:phosphoribosylformylglycinamidine synthase subunit PurQ / glutaminase